MSRRRFTLSVDDNTLFQVMEAYIVNRDDNPVWDNYTVDISTVDGSPKVTATILHLDKIVKQWTGTSKLRLANVIMKEARNVAY